MRRSLVIAAAALLSSTALVFAQMGDPAKGPSKIPNEQLDPARSLAPGALESAQHKPLPEEYIWTRQDAVPERPGVAHGWNGSSTSDLAPHYFRREFEISAVPQHATLYVAGPRSATIYVNGQQVGKFELNLSEHMGIRVYDCDVTAALRPGRNVVAIAAVRGPDVGNGADNRLAVQLTHGEVLAAKIVPAERGVEEQPLVMSDRQWRATMQAAPSGWQLPDFDDSGWTPADSLGGIESSIEFFQWNADAGMYAWPGYDGISPFLAHYRLPAMKLLSAYGGSGGISDAEALTGGAGELSISLPSAHVDERRAPQVVLDFGREVSGRIAIASDSDSPADVTVQYGESEAEAMLEPHLGIDPIHIAPHATAYGPKSAFRYAVVRFTGGSDTRFKSIALDGIAYPVEYRGSFESSDRELNQMWAIGAYTAHLCMLDDIWDAPKRDRGRWMGDLDVSGRTIEDAFDDHFLMQDTLGRLIGPAPIKQHVNGIPGYSAFWVTGEAQYYRYTGSKQQLESVHTRLVQLLDYMAGELDQRSVFTNRTHAWPFVDWSPELYFPSEETQRANQAEFYAAFRDGAYLLRELHDGQNAAAMDQRADAMKAAAQQYLTTNGSFGDRWQPNAYAVLSGIADPSQYSAIWKNALASVGHVKYNALIITPYYNYYVISAMARMGQRKAALDWIRQYWGGMLQEGATSYWEGYDPSWYKGYLFHASLQADAQTGFNASLAHGWSSGVTPWLMEQVLGIQVTGAGFSAVDNRPDLIDLTWAKGAEPTPHGMLGVSIRKRNGYITAIDLPPDVVARVSVPVSGANATVSVNGKQVQGVADENGTRSIIKLSGAGHYEVDSK